MPIDLLTRRPSNGAKELNVPPNRSGVQQEQQQQEHVLHNINTTFPENSDPPHFSTTSTLTSLPPVYEFDGAAQNADTSYHGSVNKVKTAGESRYGTLLREQDAASQIPTFRAGTASIGSLPPVYVVNNNPNSTIHGDVGAVSECSDESLLQRSEETQCITLVTANQRQASTTIPVDAPDSHSRFGGTTVAIAERVATIASFADLDDDLECQLEDRVRRRAYQIAVNVLDGIRQNAVHADEVTGTMATAEVAVDSMTTTAVPMEQRLPSYQGALNDKQLRSSSIQRCRVHHEGPKTPPPVPFSRCSFCAGGARSRFNLTDLRNLQLWGDLGFASCADVYVYVQNLSSTDSFCPTLQALAYIQCRCETVPPRPTNAVCNACPNGVIARGDSICTDFDAAVTIVASSSLSYFEKCATFVDKLWRGAPCSCENSTSRKVQ